MANRLFRNRQYSLVIDPVTLWARVTIGASGAVSSFSGKGIKSIVKEAGAGLYTITLDDAFIELLDVDAKIAKATLDTAITKIQLYETPATIDADFRSSKTIQIQCAGSTSATDTTQIAANPSSGCMLMIEIKVKKSSV